MDGWNTFSFPIGWNGLFSGVFWLVSGRVCWLKPTFLGEIFKGLHLWFTPHPGCNRHKWVGWTVGIPDPKNGSCHPGGDWHPGWGSSKLHPQSSKLHPLKNDAWKTILTFFLGIVPFWGVQLLNFGGVSTSLPCCFCFWRHIFSGCYIKLDFLTHAQLSWSFIGVSFGAKFKTFLQNITPGRHISMPNSPEKWSWDIHPIYRNLAIKRQLYWNPHWKSHNSLQLIQLCTICRCYFPCWLKKKGEVKAPHFPLSIAM